MTGTNLPNAKNRRSWMIWIILLVAFLLAFMIWRYYDIRIEKLKSGTIMQIRMPLDPGHPFIK